MARICKSCGTDRHRHRWGGFMGRDRLCPVRPMNRKERRARGLPAEPRKGEAARFIVDHNLLIPEEA